MSTPYLHSTPVPSRQDWAARLIPGAGLLGRDAKSVRKPVQSAPLNWRATAHRPQAESGETLPEHPSTSSISNSRSGVRNTFLIGASTLGRQIERHLRAHSEGDRLFCGFLDDDEQLTEGVIGRTSQLASLSRAVFADEVIIATPHDRELCLRILQEARRLRLDVKIAVDLFGCAPQIVIEHIGGVPVISLHEERLPTFQLFVKRLIDFMGALAALLLFVPVAALICLLIKMDSPGSILYSAPRAGRKGHPFRCYKFRTMVEHADALKNDLRKRNQRQGPFFKITDDPRITRIGRILRRFSLDEFPQLINVLKGEMSLVGPRPHPLDDFSGYQMEDLPRLDVTPGMTGLWQVTSRRDPSFQTGMRLDIEYIRHWSLGMDLRILLKTAGVVLRGDGQ